MSQSPEHDALYLSPHLDDAALSCGGQIHLATQAGQKVLVATLLTADEPTEGLSALAQDLHREWDIDGGVYVERRREDEAALAVLGAEVRHCGLVDALYRRGADGSHLYTSLTQLYEHRPQAGDEAQVDRLAQALRELPPARRVVSPLGAGHVDHKLLRLAAERVFGGRLLYYEDYPYVRKRRRLWRALGWPWRWRSEVVPLDDALLAVKCRALECYASQLVTVFPDPGDLEREVAAYARRVGGERLWRRRG